MEIEDFTAFLDLAGVVAFRVDAGCAGVTILGERSAERLGLAHDVAIELDAFLEKLPRDARSDLVEAFRRTLADGITRSVEHSLDATPQETWLRTTVMRRGASLLGVMRDVTEDHFGQGRVREIESWLGALGEALPFDLWVSEPNGRCVLQSPASRARVGNRVGQAIAGWEGAFERALRGEHVREDLEEAEGRSCVRVSAPIREGGSVKGVLGVEIDVTELKEAQTSLQRSIRDLHEAQEALVRRKQLAVLGEMSAAVAHEIRNPLGAISNAVAVLKKTPLDDHDRSRLCSIIDEEVTRLARLVESLLDSVRPMRAVLAPTRLEGVLDDALASAFEVDVRADPVRVHRSVDPALPLVQVDPQLLGVALSNVIRNALQAMPSTGDLFVTIGREDGWARLSIRDSGPGIARDVEDRVFEPFVTTRPTGSGLGLAIVRRVMEEHRGTVDITSEPGQGTTCVMRLPIGEDPG